MPNNISDISGSNIKNSMNIVLYDAFLIFIFLTLSLGRSFSLLHVGHLFITEIALFFSLIYFLFNARRILSIPASFTLPILGYFTLGSMHLLLNILGKDIFALRGIVFFGYIMFLPAAFISFSNVKLLKRFVIILIVSNLVGLTLARLCIYRQSPLIPQLIYWWGGMKAINFVLYFGLTLSFLLPIMTFIDKKWQKLLIALLCSFNFYMLMIWGVRTSWIALIALILFLAFLLKKSFFKTLVYFALIFLLASAIFGLTIDRNVFKEDTFLPKLTSFVTFIKKKAFVNQIKSADLIKMSTNLQKAHQPGTDRNPEVPGTLNTVNPTTPAEPSKSAECLNAPKSFETTAKVTAQADNKDPIRKARSMDFISYFSNIQWRLIIWKHALREGFEFAVFGKGFNITINPLYFNEKHENLIGPNLAVIPIHNHIVAIFNKLGIIGLGLFLFCNIYCFLYGLSYLKVCNSKFVKCLLIGSIGGLLYWNTIALFFDVIDSPPMSIFIWVIMGLIFACVSADKNNPNGLENEKP